MFSCHVKKLNPHKVFNKVCQFLVKLEEVLLCPLNLFSHPDLSAEFSAKGL